MATATAEPKKHHRVIHTWVSDRLADEAKARAVREDRTVSNLIRVALNQYLSGQSHEQTP